ncbi:cytochrome ubiquinol oxidase subunit I [Rhodoplanes sp. TEM]|uniref:Cytochrome ubiquinol oxidase subunit I n=1 Tax=Rhodoplanes tepidamans TaxID=200616 RepID=A0ABT5JIC8_RHOTP|nr:MULTISPECIES: cytochrome ubiquinol oxidase subunit I [Rhodoplanes]MDC7789481.1 cytochrome ubiquinol oxidase subunit I [Rhodoplanes tepidamans]MDC7986111.1 cytochrome ubiquinol oxidase subunit I [Rhodoplanes sp. TEM]
MDFDPLLLARVQFAFTITFHIIFPSFTIGLSAYIATLLVIRLRTGDERYARLAQFWTKIFAVSFALGVVSGIVLSYQFGTNWSRFSVVVGNVIGPMLGYEVLTAFFLEASFLGIMLFGGGGRVPPVLHALAAVIVAIGTATSAFWILSANSWMQTPAGHVMIDGVAHPQDWWAIIFNPSFPYRLAHMVTAAYLTTAFVVLAVGARWVLRERHYDEARIMVKMAVGMIVVLAPLQVFIGDQHGLNTLKHQPAKIAAMEGHWDGSKPGDFEIFAWPDEKAETNRFSIAIPKASSLILTHDPNGLFPGLKDFAPQDRPPVKNVFFAFRIMLAIGFSMVGIAIAGAILWWRGSLFTTGWFLKLVSYTWWFGFVAIVAGWIVTESGRQPWIAYGILRTADAASPVPGGSVAATLALFVLVYGLVFSMGIYIINRMLAHGLAHGAGEPPVGGTPLRPHSAARDVSRRAM